MAKHGYVFQGKALTIRQPYASAVAFGVKPVEYRGWRTQFRGPLAIHAGANLDQAELECDWGGSLGRPTRTCREAIRVGQSRYGWAPAEGQEVPRSCVVAVASLVDCVYAAERGCWEWRLEGVVPIEPVPKTGQLGLWDCRFRYKPLPPRQEAKATTLFSWGYWGWGKTTKQLVQALDRVEMARNFGAPVFADIRLERSGRAPGFRGPAFEEYLGPDRYQWIPGLGNESIRTGGDKIKIADPAAAGELLEWALEDRSRRVIFFCGCEWPKCDGKVTCHRVKVADLLLKEAGRRKEWVEVVEWPGEEPRELSITGTREDMAALRQGRQFAKTGRKRVTAELYDVPWGSIAPVECGQERLWIVTGPPRYLHDNWELPIVEVLDGDTDVGKVWGRSAAWRKAHGLEPREHRP